MIVELISVTQDAERIIEEAGRTCYQSPPGNPKIIQAWIKAGHESMIEHASATFRVSEVSRALTHQLVRHRLASYSQQSQRYVNEQQFGYVTPDSIKNSDEHIQRMYTAAMVYLQTTYDLLRAADIPKEDARFVLPNACHTEIVITMNFREYRHFFKLRTDKHAQWEIRKMAGIMLQALKESAPNVFFDMEYPA